MSKQLITIAPDGSISGLQMKRGRGLDLRVLGPAAIVRSTEIEWDEGHQKWFVRFLQGKREHTVLVVDDLRTYNLPAHVETVGRAKLAGGWMWDYALLFADYEDAVAAEVAVIQAMRKQHGRDFV
jgi:hypothetical protein